MSFSRPFQWHIAVIAVGSSGRFNFCRDLEMASAANTVLVECVVTSKMPKSLFLSLNKIFFSSHQPTDSPAILTFLNRLLSRSHKKMTPSRLVDGSLYP